MSRQVLPEIVSTNQNENECIICLSNSNKDLKHISYFRNPNCQCKCEYWIDKECLISYFQKYQNQCVICKKEFLLLEQVKTIENETIVKLPVYILHIQHVHDNQNQQPQPNTIVIEIPTPTETNTNTQLQIRRPSRQYRIQGNIITILVSLLAIACFTYLLYYYIKN